MVLVHFLLSCNRGASFSAGSKSGVSGLESERAIVAAQVPSLLSALGKDTSTLSETVLCSIKDIEKNKTQVESIGRDAELESKGYALRFYFYNSKNDEVAAYVGVGDYGVPSHAYKFHSKRKPQSQKGSDFQRNLGILDEEGDSIRCSIQVLKRLDDGRTLELGFTQRSGALKILKDVPPKAKFVQKPKPQSKDTKTKIVLSTSVTYRSALVKGGESCKDALYGEETTGSSIDVDISSLPDGEVGVCVVTMSSSGEWQEPKDASETRWTKDTKVPDAGSTELAGYPVGLNNETVLSVAVSGVDVYRFKLVSTDTCALESGYGEAVPAAEKITSTLDNFSDGSIHLCVRGEDLAGNQIPLTDAKKVSWVKDTVSPQASDIVLSGLPSANSNDSALSVGVSGLGFLSYKYAISNQIDSCATATYGSSWISVDTVLTSALGADGGKRLCIIAKDEAGNTTNPEEAKQYDWLKDTLVPNSTDIQLSPLLTGVNNAASVNLSLTGSGILQYKYVLTTPSTSCAVATYPTTWAFISTQISEALGADGNYRLCVVARDLAGNELIASNAKTVDWTKDTQAPTSSDITLSNLPANLSNVNVLDVNVSGVASYKFALTNQGQNCSDAIYSTSWISTSTSISNSLSSDGPLRLCVLGRDTAGNETAAANAKQFDWTLNTSGVTAVISNAPSGHSSATALNVTVNGGDVIEYAFALISTGTCAAANYSSWTEVSTPITESLGADGPKILCVRGKNAASTEQAASSASSASWTKDILPPVASDITLSGVPSGTNNTTLLNIDVTGTEFVSYRYKLDTSDTCSVDTGYSLSDIANTTPITNDISSFSDGVLYICVRAKDSASNETSASGAKKLNWTKDTSAPSSADVTLSTTPSGESRQSVLDISVGGVSAYRYKLVTTNSCTADIGYSVSDIPVATHITNDISSDASYPQGNIFLCVRGVDSLGNITPISDPKVVSWVKDTVAPVASFDVVTVPQSESNEESINIDVEGSSVTHYLFALLGPNSIDTCAVATYSDAEQAIDVATPISESLGADGSYVLCVKGLDAAGNLQGTATSYAWVKDSIVPVDSDITLTSLPSNPSSVPSLNVTVGGVVAYLYSLTTQATDCSSASYNSERLINQAISDSVANGLLRLCVRGKDAAGNLTAAADAKVYNWTQDSNEPEASHITLSNTPGSRSNISPLNILITADGSWLHSSFTHYNYAVVNDHATACDDAGVVYSGFVESNNIEPNISIDGNKRLCVLVRTESGAETSKSNAKMFDWIFDTEAPGVSDIVFTDTPVDPGKDANLNVLVEASGTADVVRYKFAITNQVTTCSSLSDGAYSGFANINTRITESVGADGARRLCVFGEDVAGNATKTSAKHFDWTQDTALPTVTVNSDTSPTTLSSPATNASIEFTSNESGTYVLQDISDTPTKVVKSGAVTENSPITVTFNSGDLFATAGEHQLNLSVSDAAGNERVVELESVNVASPIKNLALNFYYDGANQSQHKLQWDGGTFEGQKLKIVRSVNTTTPPSTVAGGTLVAVIDGDKRIHTFNGVTNNQVAFSIFVCDDTGSNCAEPPDEKATVSYNKTTVVQNDSEGNVLNVRFSGNPGGSTVRLGYSKSKEDLLAWNGISATIGEGAAQTCASSPCSVTFSNDTTHPAWTKLYYKISTTTSGGVTTFSELGYWAKVPPGMVFVSREDWPVEFNGHNYSSNRNDGRAGPFNYAIDKYEVNGGGGSDNAYPSAGAGAARSESGGAQNYTWNRLKQSCENRTLESSYSAYVGNTRLALAGAPYEDPKQRVHLTTDAEWMIGSYGTSDNSSICNTNFYTTVNTGSNANCISRYGAYDMAGNLNEWTDSYFDTFYNFKGIRKTFSGTGTDFEIVSPLYSLPNIHYMSYPGILKFDFENFLASAALASYGSAGFFQDEISVTWGLYFTQASAVASLRGGNHYTGSTLGGRFNYSLHTAGYNSIASLGGRCALRPPENQLAHVLNVAVNRYYDGLNTQQYKIAWDVEPSGVTQKIKIVKVSGSTTPATTVAGGTLVATVSSSEKIHTFSGSNETKAAFSIFECGVSGTSCVEPPQATVSFDRTTLVQNDSDGNQLKLRYSGNPAGSTVRIGYSKNRAATLAWDGVTSTIEEGGVVECTSSPCSETFSNDTTHPAWTKLYFLVSTTSEGITTRSEMGYWAKVPPGMVFVAKEDWPVEFTGHNYRGHNEGDSGPFDYAIDKYETYLASGSLSSSSYPNYDTGVLMSAAGQSTLVAARWYAKKQGCENRTTVAPHSSFAGNTILARTNLTENPRERFHMVTDTEWFIGAYGTPDSGGSGNCNIDDRNGGSPFLSGSTETVNCISRYGVRDMIGNTKEWTDSDVVGPAMTPYSPSNIAVSSFKGTGFDLNVYPVDAYTNFSFVHFFTTGSLNSQYFDDHSDGYLKQYPFFRGGSFSSGSAAGRFSATTVDAEPSSNSDTNGTRCALVAP